MQLRHYQASGIMAAACTFQKGYKRLLLVAPAGSGKTVTFAYMVARSAAKGKLPLVFVDGEKLGKQAYHAIRNAGAHVAFLTANGTMIHTEEGWELISKSITIGFDAYVIMAQTAISRLKRNSCEYKALLSRSGFFVFDEAHMTLFTHIYDAYPNTPRVMFTATPLFPKGKLKISDTFDSLHIIVQPAQLVEEGTLCDFDFYDTPVDESRLKKDKDGEFTNDSVLKTYEEQSILKSVWVNYAEQANNLKTMVYAQTVEHAQKIAEFFCEQGKDARWVSAKSSEQEREDVLEWLRCTPDAILVNVGLYTKGFDEPSIRCVILLRFITSLALYIQIVGRGGRPYAGKERCIVLDFGNNLERLGRPYEDRDWKEIIAEHEKEGVRPIHTCKNCGYNDYVTVSVCASCGTPFEKNKPKSLQIGGKNDNFGDREGLVKLIATAQKQLVKEFGVSALEEVVEMPPADRMKVLKLMWEAGGGLAEYAATKKKGRKSQAAESVKALMHEWGYSPKFFYFFFKKITQ
jgi:superfamily II DNA or RNA helicase